MDEKRYGEETLSISVHDEIGPDRTLHALRWRETIDGFCSRDTTTKGVSPSVCLSVRPSVRPYTATRDIQSDRKDSLPLSVRYSVIADGRMQIVQVI